MLYWMSGLHNQQNEKSTLYSRLPFNRVKEYNLIYTKEDVFTKWSE